VRASKPAAVATLLDRRARARTAAEEAVASRPVDAAAHRTLGLLYLDEGNLNGALASLRRATFLDPSDALAHFGLGRAHAETGDAARARAALVHGRRLLAARDPAVPVPGADGLCAGDLLKVVDAQLTVLERTRVS
jgi:chemotaxis protein methyltransferase CheR